MSEELKPDNCPFCGRRPKVWPLDPETEGNAWGKVVCTNKRCPTYNGRYGYGVSVGDGASVSDERGPDAYKRAAIRRWNRRPPRVALSPQRASPAGLGVSQDEP